MYDDPSGDYVVRAGGVIADDRSNVFTHGNLTPSDKAEFLKMQLDQLERIKNGDHSGVGTIDSIYMGSNGYRNNTISLQGGEVKGDVNQLYNDTLRRYEEAVRELEGKNVIGNAEGFPTSSSKTNYNTSNPSSNTTSTAPSTTSVPASTLRLDEERINTFINKIEQSIDMLNSTWNNLAMTDIQKINDSWASNDARTYVDKLMAEGDKISDIVLALKLLEETYKKVINESTATGQDVSGSVGRL